MSVGDKVLDEVSKWMERFDCLVIGPGLGRDPFLLVCFIIRNLIFYFSNPNPENFHVFCQDCVSSIVKCAKQSYVPIVIDGVCTFNKNDSLLLWRMLY